MMEDRVVPVLIIDSDNVRRGMLACTLPATEYSLEFAASREKGLDCLVDLEPEIVIVGANNMGRDMCQHIRSLPAGERCAVVLMDERYRDETIGRAEAEAAGADNFLPFPFEVELLEERLQGRAPAERHERKTRTGEQRVAPAAPADDAVAAAPAPAEDAWLDFQKRVEITHRKLNSTDYYTLLQVPRDATASTIKSAYFSRSMEFHPDRFMRLEDDQIKVKIYEIFKRTSEAFKVLINSEARSRYDANLAGPDRDARLPLSERDHGSLQDDPTANANTPAGKKYLHYAILAESEGKLRSARMYLSMAMQYEPENEALQARLDGITRSLK
jgi:CheY-like chemotaxis protein